MSDIGPDPANPRSVHAGIARIYRGLGISALRSITTHGLLWTFFDLVANYIDELPPSPPPGDVGYGETGRRRVV